MKILHLVQSDSGGGAGRMALRLHKQLRKLGVDSWMMVADKRSDDPTVLAPTTLLGKAWGQGAFLLDALPLKLTKLNNQFQHSPAWIRTCNLRKALALQPDLIQLQWICGGFLRIESLSKLKKPLVWELADMWPFSGAEHYVEGNERYCEGYTKQNRPQGEKGWDLNRWVWQRKRRAWESLHNLTIAAPSRWMADCARASVLFRDRRIEVIPTGQDLQRFKPVEHQQAREILGLPKDKKLVLFGAMSVTDPRKGFSLLQAALNRLSGQYQHIWEVVVFGSAGLAVTGELGFKAYSFGRLHDEISLALLYGAADVFVAPSIAENLPNTVIEAMGCGTPVVAFKTGGFPDLIIHQENGFLAQPFEASSLAEGIAWVLQDESRWRALSLAARSKVKEEFSIEREAQLYRSLYESIIQ